MNRRTLLTVVASSIATTSGCVGGRNTGSKENSGKEENYEPCNTRVLSYPQLPQGVKNEVDVAFEKGQYATRGELLWKEIDGPDLQAIQKDGDYYSPIVDTNGVFPFKETTLQFEKTTPQYDRPVSFSIYQSVANTLNISITVKYGDKIVHEEQNISIQEKVNPLGDPPKNQYEDKSNRRKIPIGRKYGEYMLDIDIGGRGSVTESFELGGGHSALTPDTLYIKEENSDLSVDITRKHLGDPASCPWEANNP